MIIIQVVYARGPVRKLKAYRRFDTEKVDISVWAGRVLGMRVRNSIIHCNVGIEISELERILEQAVK